MKVFYFPPALMGEALRVSLIVFIVSIALIGGVFGFATAHTIVVIEMSEDGFAPQEVEIFVGDEVVFENVGSSPMWPASDIHPTHSIYPDSHIEKCGTTESEKMFDACELVLPGQSWHFVFEYEGVWRFHDHINSELGGKITVLDRGDSDGKKGFIARIFDSIKNFFSRIYSLVFKKDSQGSVERLVFDGEISRDSKEVFYNEDALYSYVKKFGPAQATLRLHELQSEFGNCHNTAHEAGRLAYKVYGNESFRLCSAECHSGCYHGATEAFFRENGTTNLADNLKTICSSDLNPFFSHQCIHGIGHGLMAWTNYNLFEALESCDLLPERQNSCWTGVFMENYVGGLAKFERDTNNNSNELRAHFTDYLSDDPHFPCNHPDLEEKYKDSCYFLQTSRMVKIFSNYHNSDLFLRIAKECYSAPEAYQRSCFLSMGRDVGGFYYSNPELAVRACNSAIQGKARENCLIGAVQNYFWDMSGQDNAINFCKLVSEEAEKSSCYNTVFQRAHEILPSMDDIERFCLKAEKEYQKKCIII